MYSKFPLEVEEEDSQTHKYYEMSLKINKINFRFRLFIFPFIWILVIIVGDQKHHSYVRWNGISHFNGMWKLFRTNSIIGNSDLGYTIHYYYLAIIGNGFICMAMRMAIIEIRCKWIFIYFSCLIGLCSMYLPDWLPPAIWRISFVNPFEPNWHDKSCSVRGSPRSIKRSRKNSNVKLRAVSYSMVSMFDNLVLRRFSLPQLIQSRNKSTDLLYRYCLPPLFFTFLRKNFSWFSELIFLLFTKFTNFICRKLFFFFFYFLSI